MSEWKSFDSPGANKLRAAAIPCLICGIVQLSCAASASRVFVNESYGSWYAVNYCCYCDFIYFDLLHDAVLVEFFSIVLFKLCLISYVLSL